MSLKAKLIISYNMWISECPSCYNEIYIEEDSTDDFKDVQNDWNSIKLNKEVTCNSCNKIIEIE